MARRLKIGIIGMGRMGSIHHRHLKRDDRIGSIPVCDSKGDQMSTKFKFVDPFYTEYQALIDSERPDAVFICSPTPSHYEIIKYCCDQKVHVFCEKPVDLDKLNIQDIKNSVEQNGIVMQVGFNRRFDPDFSTLKKGIVDGLIGDVHQITITSRDPGLAAMEYVKTSGGMFMDMSIHDFDMARFLTGDEVSEVYAKGQVRIYESLKDIGDIDTATIVLTFAQGATCTIINSRKAVYGYDQRIEVFGAKGMLTTSNRTDNKVDYWGSGSVQSARPLHFFMQRYLRSYEIEAREFIDCVLEYKIPSVTIDDALRATEIAEFANDSYTTGRALKVLIE